ncbi:hypothetical protein GWI33_010431 [Rhynchophorus ferrugineus]|uniref:Uncharacterized protein n=1 Tax=Rhynchophorus ferrugineus TaxID=354439 RepID=A0A834I9B2_RHYFE|nr:hypothetical protein GWI33_010431 [Rhynchophorus ferrugineus]
MKFGIAKAIFFENHSDVLILFLSFSRTGDKIPSSRYCAHHCPRVRRSKSEPDCSQFQYLRHNLYIKSAVEKQNVTATKSIIPRHQLTGTSRFSGFQLSKEESLISELHAQNSATRSEHGHVDVTAIDFDAETPKTKQTIL